MQCEEDREIVDTSPASLTEVRSELEAWMSREDYKCGGLTERQEDYVGELEYRLFGEIRYQSKIVWD